MWVAYAYVEGELPSFPYLFLEFNINATNSQVLEASDVYQDAEYETTLMVFMQWGCIGDLEYM